MGDNGRFLDGDRMRGLKRKGERTYSISYLSGHVKTSWKIFFVDIAVTKPHTGSFTALTIDPL